MEAPVVCFEGKDGEGVMHSTPETIPFQSFHFPAALQASGLTPVPCSAEAYSEKGQMLFVHTNTQSADL